LEGQKKRNDKLTFFLKILFPFEGGGARVFEVADIAGGEFPWVALGGDLWGDGAGGLIAGGGALWLEGDGAGAGVGDESGDGEGACVGGLERDGAGEVPAGAGVRDENGAGEGALGLGDGAGDVGDGAGEEPAGAGDIGLEGAGAGDECGAGEGDSPTTPAITMQMNARENTLLRFILKIENKMFFFFVC